MVAPEEEEDLWTQILKEVKQENDASSTSKALQKRTVLILGDRKSGKTSLLTKLEGKDLTDEEVAKKKSIGLGYDYMEVFDDETDDLTGSIDIWTFEGEPGHDNLLHYALNETNAHHACVLITLDMSHPWNLISSLRKWLGVLKTHIATFESKLPQNFSHKLRNYLYSYSEPHPHLPTTGKTKKKKLSSPSSSLSSTSTTPLHSTPSLEDATLVFNLGIPIIVVCCKADSSRRLEREMEFHNETFDYIQLSLRQMCISYGAALLYTSSRNDTNLDLLMEYIEHFLFNYEFSHPSQLFDKESIFIPAGWDSMPKIYTEFGHLSKICNNPSEAYENVIVKPSHLKRREGYPLIIAEQDQDFLQRQKSSLDLEEPSRRPPLNTTKFSLGINNEPTPFISVSPRPGLSPASSASSSTVVSPMASPVQTPKEEASRNQTPDSTKDKQVLANFFASLMTTKDKNAKFTLPEDAAKKLESIKKVINK